MEKELEEVLKRIKEKFYPVSVFLYGSRARADFLSHSDYEIGVLFSKEQKITRAELKEINSSKKIVLYPFAYEDFISYKIDTPFPENIYFRELIGAGRTIQGKKVIENMTPPSITILDLLQRVRFDTAFALASVLSHRNGDLVTTKMEFSKACLFGIRCLIIAEKKQFPFTYDEIYEASHNLELGEFSEVVEHAIDVRKGGTLNEIFLYKNISMLNKLVKERIMEIYKTQGDMVVL